MEQDLMIKTDLWQNKRGRPKKIHQAEWLKIQVALIENINYTCPIIRELHTKYLSEIFTEDLIILLKKVLSRVKIPYKFRHLPIYSLLEESMKSLMINKIELLVFGKIIENTDLENTSLEIEELLKVLLFISKESVEADSKLMNFLRNSLNQEIKQFNEKLKMYSLSEIPSIYEINNYYSNLQKRKLADVNYSYYIDEILRNSPPYNKNKKNKEKKERKIEDCLNKKQKCSDNLYDKAGEMDFLEAENEMGKICEDFFSFIPTDNDCAKIDYNDYEIAPLKWTSEDDWLNYQEESYDMCDI